LSYQEQQSSAENTYNTQLNKASNYAGKYTSKSNEVFDLRIKSNNPLSGIRDFEEIMGLELVIDHAMPENNRLLHFKRIQ
jgi:hypothetical protein